MEQNYSENQFQNTENQFQNSRICVAGVGAIGTVVSTVIGQKYGENLSLFARGARAEALRRDGLILHSDFYGEKTACPASVSDRAEELGRMDYILICVKNYALEDIAEQLRLCIGPKTVLAPVMNGIEAADRLRELFPEAIVADAVIYCATGMNADFSATQRGNYAHAFIGCKNREERQQDGARRLCGLLRSAGFDSRWSDVIESEIWQKFIHNCAFNTITARYMITSGQLRRSERCRQDLRCILEEGYEVAKKCGIGMPEDFVEKKFLFTTKTQAETATSSMKQDVAAGRRTELDAFLGALIRRAELCRVPVPKAEEYYEALRHTQNV